MTNDAITVVTPRSLAEAKELASTLSMSRIIPEALQKSPADCLAIVMTGAELGLAPMAALRALQIIRGKVTISADGMHAIAVSSPACEYIRCIETTSAVAKFEAKRKGGHPTTVSFSMEDAKAAGLTANATYQKYPAQMLRARAIAGICRLVFPDVLLGVYTPDEIQNLEPQQPRPMQVTLPARPVEPVQTDASATVLAAIEVSKTPAELIALVPQIAPLSEGEKATIRARYVARLGELEEASGAKA